MAAGTVLTQTHRQAQLRLRIEVVRDLARLWPAMDWSDLDRTFPAWAAAVGALVARHRTTSTNLSTTYLRALRQAQGLPGAPTIIPAGPVPADQLAIALRATALAGVKASTAQGVTADAAMANALVRSSGAASRLVLAGGRDTLQQSFAADPQIVGYERVTSGNGCSFCQMLADRGAVYYETSADQVVGRNGSPRGSQEVGSSYHDHCSCTTEPIFA